LGTRIHVREGIAQTFVDMLTQYAQGAAATLGSELFAETIMSSLLFYYRQKESVMGLIEWDKKDATLLTGRAIWGDKGCFLQPTILYRPKARAEIV